MVNHNYGVELSLLSSIISFATITATYILKQAHTEYVRLFVFSLATKLNFYKSYY